MQKKNIFSQASQIFAVDVLNVLLCIAAKLQLVVHKKTTTTPNTFG